METKRSKIDIKNDEKSQITSGVECPFCDMVYLNIRDHTVEQCMNVRDEQRRLFRKRYLENPENRKRWE